MPFNWISRTDFWGREKAEAPLKYADFGGETPSHLSSFSAFSFQIRLGTEEAATAAGLEM